MGLSEAGAIQLERLSLPATAAELDGLASLLLDAVESGAAVSFVLPLTRDAARAFWQTTLSDAHPRDDLPRRTAGLPHRRHRAAPPSEDMAPIDRLEPRWTPD